MMSSLKQHITSLVQDFIPLGPSRRHSTDAKSSSTSVLGSPPQGTPLRPGHTPRPMNPFTKRTLPLQRPEKDHIVRPSGLFPSGSNTGSGLNKDGVVKHSVLQKKTQLNNNLIPSSADAQQCAAPFPTCKRERKFSADQEREFSLALSRKLNENLKVGRGLTQSGSVGPPGSSSVPSFSRSKAETQTPSDPRRSSFSQAVTTQRNEQSSTENSPVLSPQQKSTPPPPCTLTHLNTSQATPRPLFKQSLSEGREVKRRDTLIQPCNAVNPGDRLSVQSASCERKTVSFSPVCEGNDAKRTVAAVDSSDSISVLDADSLPLLSTMPKEKLNSDRRSAFSTSHSTSGFSDCHKLDSPPLSPHSPAPSGLSDVGPSRAEASDCQHNSTAGQSLSRGQKREDKSVPVWSDPLDMELDLGVHVDDCALSSSSSSSEEDQLLSLKEIMERSARPPATPEKGVISEPSTPRNTPMAESKQNRDQSYRNTLDQMLLEKEENQRSKEREMQLLQSCKDDLLRLSEEEEEEDGDNRQEDISEEQKEFLQKYSVISSAIRDVHPGEEVFTLSKFGRLFSHRSLELRKCSAGPRNRAQSTLLQCSTEQALLLIRAGILKRAYGSAPCPPSVARWLFQMMSVHPNPGISSLLLQSLKFLALSAAQSIVENRSDRFQVWVPSVRDVSLVFLNMGASFISLFPLDSLQPSFTEGDLLEGLEILSDDVYNEVQHITFPESNFENVIKYLAICAALCPHMYSDEDLLLLMSMVCRVSLETRLQMLPSADVCCLLQHLINNISHWPEQLARICQIVSELTDDHHNLRRLVQLLPHSSRGKQLRRHLSLTVISKLLNQSYTPTSTEFQLSDLHRYLPLMRPSFLLKNLQSAQGNSQHNDQQAYYLCYSLLALVNEASNFEFLPANQKNELKLLSAELEKHIKCDIRESEKQLYRSKVKDFVARIYTRWQVLLQRSRPLQGKLYDYWQPLPEDAVSSSHEKPSREEEEEMEQEEDEDDEDFHSEPSEEEMEEEEEVH
ncbi:SMC5-SMC6 complex localization factor protein 2 [Chanos chanos]|uniref:SMC5-SMC6 complex localization factor protein 2 n=1 Tax=Chanos chanos TaxID=29144 RepID=A0A6J2V5B2_CHACN|nr:SMC5-SMC6 complex localization factor protein 2-like [Chanos chanos]